jgi:hypothetical protein
VSASGVGVGVGFEITAIHGTGSSNATNALGACALAMNAGE